MVVLTAIKNHSNIIRSNTVWATNAYYKFEVSFGYYALTISAPGYKPYNSTVFIPSGSTLQ